jgi:geranylgeranyl diphosphate synthase type II
MGNKPNLFREYLESARPDIDAALERLLPPEHGPAARLREAMRYSVLGGGKRLRPALCLAAFRLFHDNPEPVMPVACAFEMVHAFTLIHDDLPCMDDDDLRRGRPTSHKKFGEAMAVLAGDALHNFAYQTLTTHLLEHSSMAAARAALKIFTRAVGLVCEGQAVDMETEGADPDPQLLEFIHENKTAALIVAPVLCGAICGGATKDRLDALTTFAAAAGMLFQNADDILDKAGDPSVTGKSGPGDEERGKLTTVRALGLERAAALAREQRDRAAAALQGIPRSDVLAAFPQLVYDRIPERLR